MKAENERKEGEHHETSESYSTITGRSTADGCYRMGERQHRLRPRRELRAQYKTYSWGKIQTANGLWDERVKDAIASQLAAQGWTEVPSGGDVVIAARDAVQNQQELNTFYDGFGGGRWFGGVRYGDDDHRNHQGWDVARGNV